MLSSIARAVRVQQPKLRSLSRAVGAQAPKMTLATSKRYFSSTDPQVFKPNPPMEINQEMAESIQDTTLFYLRHGISNQRLVALSQDQESPLVDKWQRMMEIYLSTQVFVISGLGFSGDETGLQLYTQVLSHYMQGCNDEIKETYRKVGTETWRELLCTAFTMDLEEIKSIPIVDARNIMHKVSSKMQEPNILMKVQKECAKVPSTPEIEMEMAHKHQVLQNIILNDVYMGGSPTIPEESGFGTGEKGYAHMQCVMAEYEGDPLIAQYMAAATSRIWEAAGLDIASLQGAGGGNIRNPQSGV